MAVIYGEFQILFFDVSLFRSMRLQIIAEDSRKYLKSKTLSALQIFGVPTEFWRNFAAFGKAELVSQHRCH